MTTIDAILKDLQLKIDFYERESGKAKTDGTPVVALLNREMADAYRDAMRIVGWHKPADYLSR